MKVLLITGSYPPAACGVGDYTACLAHALGEKGVEVDVLTGQDWSVWGVAKLLSRIDSYGADVLHLQYPTRGFGYRLGPHLASLLRPGVVTIHEASDAHLLRRLSLYGFSLRSSRVIFTNEGEHKYSIGWCPWIRSKSVVIPIGTNVETGASEADAVSGVIGYFGLMRPAKGLEEIVSAARLLQQSGSRFRVRIIGRVVPGLERYYADLRRSADAVPIEWCIDVDDTELGMLIRTCDFAYLPFPDGASERRASLIAFLSAGVCIVTTRGAQTPDWMQKAMRFSRDAGEAVEIMHQLAGQPAETHALRRAAREAAKRFSWPMIAEQHVALYAEVLKAK